MDTCFEGIRTETESYIDRQCRNLKFCYELAEQHAEMERFINECIIKASGNKKAINEMYVIQESAFFDKIKGFFEKIKNFFKKIFSKLGASMSALFSEQKKYCDKYAYIITNCKWQGGDVSDVKDHFKGISRIVDAVEKSETSIYASNTNYLQGEVAGDSEHWIALNTFDSADSIEKAQIPTEVKTEEIKVKSYETFIASPYWKGINDFAGARQDDSNGNIDIEGTFRAWFDGSKDTVAWSNDEIETNFQTIINCVYAGQSYLNKIENIVNTVTKKMDEAQKNMENYHKTQQEKIMQAVKNTAGKDAANSNFDPNKDKVQGTAIDAIKQDATTKKFSYTYKGKTFTADSTKDLRTAISNAGITVENYIFNEMNIDNSNSKSDSVTDADNKSAKGNLNNRGTDDVNKAGEQNTKLGEKKANTMTAQNVNDVDMSGKNDKQKSELQTKAEEILKKDIHNKQVKINADIQISSSVARAIFSSFQSTNKDFFDIIKAHVQWYLSNPGEEKKPENKTTTTKNLNLNAGNSLEHTETQQQQSQQQQQQQSQQQQQQQSQQQKKKK